ncbi:MAG TPA: neutral/alkaline non-lysosomal ceramidase N-terminal domain-containing protein [Mariniphaga sp.]|nr:neutral/alkaline non-lysosomal ceramidase N-terminal domain-containing protein [Mariniphaga sp.]
MIFKYLIFFLIIFTSCVRENSNSPFEAGTGVIDITPPVGYPRYGYPSEKSTGVLDPLLAKALVFKQGDVQGAILVCNLLAIPRDLSRIVRERASARTGIPFQNITVSATHTHTSPRITKEFKEYALRELSGELTEEDQISYFSFLIDGMTEAIVSAYNNLIEMNLFSGIGEAPGITFNRRYLMTDGRVRFNPGRKNSKVVKPAGPVDTDVHFLFLRSDGRDQSSASLSVFASHYVRGGSEFSSDYPFYLQERLKEIYGVQHTSVFGLGACGNVNTVNLKGETEEPNNKVRNFGKELADVIEKVLPITKQSVPNLKIVSQTIYLPLQDFTQEELTWSKEDSSSLYQERDFLSKRRKLKISEWGVQPPLELLRVYEAVPPAVSGEPWYLPVEIHVFKLDPKTAIVTMPGELFTEFGIDLKKRSPFSNTMLIELANADIAYIPTIQGFKEGDYEAINSRLIPGAGEVMIDSAIEILNRLK